MSVLSPSDQVFDQLLHAVEHLRNDTNARLVKKTQTELAQYTTPLPVAEFMAQCFPPATGPVRLLDAGAGVGSLSAAAVARWLSEAPRPPSINCTGVEVDAAMAAGLARTYALLEEAAQRTGVTLHTTLIEADFLTTFAPVPGGLLTDLADGQAELGSFTHVIMNPPYKKIRGLGGLRGHLTAVGLDSTNLYTAFLDLAVRLLEPGGELVAVTPRSFFNGTYFRPFRRRFLSSMTLERIHLTESRKDAFKDNDVLQETVIFHARKVAPAGGTVLISSSAGFAEGQPVQVRKVPYASLVHPDDPEQFIRVDVDDRAAGISGRIAGLPATLEDLGLKVSTGKLVDFRALEHLGTSEAGEGQPLIYPGHLSGGQVHWPTPLIGKPNVVHGSDTQAVRKLLVPEGYYVLVKRFSAKEEARRVSAAVYEPERTRPGPVAFENKVNYVHANGSGLPRPLALGLCAYLNSTAFDVAFRQFSGHTQVNVTDLKQLRFPPRATLERLGAQVELPLPDQDVLDALVETEVFPAEARADKRRGEFTAQPVADGPDA